MLAVFAVGMKQILLNTSAAVQNNRVGAVATGDHCLSLPVLHADHAPVTALVVWFVLHRRFVEQFVGADVIAMVRQRKGCNFGARHRSQTETAVTGCGLYMRRRLTGGATGDSALPVWSDSITRSGCGSEGDGPSAPTTAAPKRHPE